MGRRGPLGGYVLYLDCLECEDKICKRGDSVITYTKAKEGYKFVPTKTAPEKVVAKYDKAYAINIRQYKLKVPSTWVEKGYVKEVKE